MPIRKSLETYRMPLVSIRLWRAFVISYQGLHVASLCSNHQDFSVRFVSVHVLLRYKVIDLTEAKNKLFFVSLGSLDFQIFYILWNAFPGFPDLSVMLIQIPGLQVFLALS